MYFEVFRQEKSDEQRPTVLANAGSGRNRFAVLLWLLISVKAGAVFLAWRNLRLGRGDRASTMAIAIYTFVVGMAVWGLQASHVGGLLEGALFHSGLCRAAGFSLVIWIFYIAAEPFVRRVWPELLISSTRLLKGQFCDPRVGRDLVVGTLATTCSLAIAGVWGWFGLPFSPSFHPLSLLGPTALTSVVLDLHLQSIVSALVALVFLLLLRIVLRQRAVAIAGVVLVLTVGQARQFELPPAGWILALLFSILFVSVLVRFGPLALCVALFVYDVLQLPFTTDTSAFYFGNGLFGSAVVAAIALFSYYTSLGGKAAFGEVALDRNR